MLNPVGYNAKGECLEQRKRFLLRPAIGHDTRELRNLRQPAPISFTIQLYAEDQLGLRHKGIVPLRTKNPSALNSK